MTYRPRARCRRCDRRREYAGGLSRSGLCPACSPVVMSEALTQIATRSGPHYDAWLNGLTDAVASLWGAREIPGTVTSQDDQEQLAMEASCPVGF